MITTLRNLLNVSLCGKIPTLPDNYKNPSTTEEQVIHDVYIWLFHNRYNDLTYHVYLMWNAIRALFATGMTEVSDEDVDKILLDPRASSYFITNRSAEVMKITSLANTFLKKWKNVHIEKQDIPFDLNIHTGIPNMSDLVFCYSDPQESSHKRACKLDRTKSF